MTPIHRCPWPGDNQLMIEYHDTEWGVPLHDDRKLFEFIVLDGAQAGLAWQTIINKREGYRKAFNDFDAEKIAQYMENEVERLMNDSGIVRHRLKINGTISNAQKFLEIQEKHGSFDGYIWKFTDGETIQNRFRTLSEVPATTKESDAMSKELKKFGFKFVGSTICYAFMQAAGMVNDHLVDCFRYDEVTRAG